MTDRRTAWSLVGDQFLLLAVILIQPGGEVWCLPGGLHWGLRAVAVAGLAPMAIAAVTLGRGLTAAPLPNAHAQLRTGGLYRLVRHPIYSGLLLSSVAWAIASGSLVAGPAALLGRADQRQGPLGGTPPAERFPAYPAYAAVTPRFLPPDPLRLRSPGAVGVSALRLDPVAA